MEKENTNNNLSSREVVARDLPHPMLLNKEEKQPCFTREAEDPGQKISGMTSLFDNDNDKSGRPRIKCGETLSFQGVGPVFARPARTGAPLRSGFTLIELLVVVLIIGVLAAVAVPQYRMAVDKARLMKLVAMTKSVVEAQEAYYLANNTYTQDWDVLAVTLPGTVNSNVITSPDGWTIVLHRNTGGGAANGLTAADNKIANIILYAFYTNGNENISQSPAGGGISCYAKSGDTYANKLCKNVTRKTTPDSGGVMGANTYSVYKF